MALNKLLVAAEKLQRARDQIESLKERKQRLQDTLTGTNNELAAARAVAAARVDEVKIEALEAVSP